METANRMLIESWSEIDPDNSGLTAGQLLGLLHDFRDKYGKIREAILELCGGSPEKLPTVRSVGNKLRHLKGRIMAGVCIDSQPDRTGTQVWRVSSVSRVSNGETDADSAGSAGSAHSQD